MRVAALYDIHGNLPALEAVLQEVRDADVDQVVIGGGVVPGPMPRESIGPAPMHSDCRWRRSCRYSKLQAAAHPN